MKSQSSQTYDSLFIEIADYVHDYVIDSRLAYQTAHWALLDSLGCLCLALNEPQCFRLLGPWVSGTLVPLGSRVPGTAFELDPIKAAFDIGAGIRWLDYNDTWLAAEWAHPSDNLGAILAIGDFISRRSETASNDINEMKDLTVHDLFTAQIKAYEIQGVLALENAFNRLGLDHVVLVKIASAAVASKLMGLSKIQTMDVLSNAWIDGQSLRTYRHAPNTGSRKSWAAGDASSRGLRLAWMTLQGEQGYPSALSANTWGFEDALFKGQKIKLAGPLGCYVMENILFKVAYPAEFHAQTAVEAAIQLYSQVKDRWADIERIELFTQEPAMRIIHKEGPLHNYADRDHCLQYMVAIALLNGELKPEHYSDKFSRDPNIDRLRSKMKVLEDKTFSRDYLDPEKRAIANAIQIFFRDGSSTELIRKDYPLGHQRRRGDALPLLKNKYAAAINSRFSGKQAASLIEFWDHPEALARLSVSQFMNTWVQGVKS